MGLTRQVQAASSDDSGDFVDTETVIERPYSFLHFGRISSWQLMLLGFLIYGPVSFLRFFFPQDCAKNIFRLIDYTVEGVLFMNELSMVEEGWVIFDTDDPDKASQVTFDRNL